MSTPKFQPGETAWSADYYRNGVGYFQVVASLDGQVSGTNDMRQGGSELSFYKTELEAQRVLHGYIQDRMLAETVKLDKCRARILVLEEGAE